MRLRHPPQGTTVSEEAEVHWEETKEIRKADGLRENESDSLRYSVRGKGERR